MSVKVIRKGRSAEKEVATVLVYERTKLARIDWDYFRFPEVNDDYFKDNAEQLTRDVMDIYRSHASPKSSFSGNGLVGHMEDMPIERAREAGEMLSNLFELFIAQRPSVER